MSGEEPGAGELPPRSDSGQAGDDAALSAGGQLPPPDEQTRAMSPEQINALLREPVRIPTPPGGDSRHSGARPWVVALSALLIVAVLGGGLYVGLRARGGGSSPAIAGCASDSANTPCTVANAYLLAYTGMQLEQMYALTSNASRQRFSDPQILRGNYKDAHDYMVNRTASMLAQAAVYQIGATPGKLAQSSAASASVPVRVVMQSSRVGSFTQDITLPLSAEGGQWRVDWSPGVIFSKLDDPTNDPHYALYLHLFPENAQRGRILDRDGNVLAKDDTVYEIGVVPGRIKDEKTLLGVLGAKLGMSADEIKSKYQNRGADQFVVIRTITQDLYNQVGAAVTAVAGVSARQTTGRVYPYGQDLAAVTGYVSDVTQDDLQNDTTHYYGAADQIGRAGVEAWGEAFLRPVKGGKLAVASLNADGFSFSAVSTIAERDAQNGDDIHTTISLKNQQSAMAALRSRVDGGHGKGGGAFVVDPTTGEVLVQASYPIYDPTNLALGATDEQLAQYNASGAFLGRALQDPRAVGSVFKVVDLAAALQNGIGAQDFTCNGKYQVPGETTVRNDDSKTGHGTRTPEKALAPSCDVIFWQVAIKLNSMDPTILPKMAQAMGLGTSPDVVGMPAGAQDPGLVPDPAYAASQGKQWNASFAADLAVGQGDFQATPAQVALMTAAIANGGQRMQPRLVTQVLRADGSLEQAFPAKALSTLPISTDNLAALQASMLGTVETPSGTSYHVFQGFPILVAGKTGTAENGNKALPHAWFTCYAPASPLSGPLVTPQIAAALELQNAGNADANAAPAARQLLATFFNVK